MQRLAGVLGALVVVLGIAVPIGLSDDGAGKDGTATPAVTCGRTVFAAGILGVGVDSIVVRPGAVRVTFAPPIDVAAYRGDLDGLIAKVQSEIASRLSADELPVPQ